MEDYDIPGASIALIQKERPPGSKLRRRSGSGQKITVDTLCPVYFQGYSQSDEIGQEERSNWTIRRRVLNVLLFRNGISKNRLR